MSLSIPTKQKALVIPEKFAPFVVSEVDVPKPGPAEILVRVEAVGLSPADWKVHEQDPFNLEYPLILGFDAAGVVVQLGEGVTSFAVGDKVLHPGVPWDHSAAFKQYTVAQADLCAKVPSNLTVDQAASVPAAITTAVLGLYCKSDNSGGAGLTPPWEEDGRGKYAGQSILILGGSAAVGQPAIQFAKLSGFSPIIATASLKNAELLKSLGATHVLDRHMPGSSIIAAVREITKEPIRVVYDGVSSEDIQLAGYELLASGGIFVALTGATHIAEDKCTADKVITHLFGNPYLEDRRQLAVAVYKHIPALFESRELKPINVEVLPGGLGGITAGLLKLKNGEISATKLIVHPPETV